ncbi:serine repeat antigen 4 [Plakobranchus ocellatus]|uniref:Serine repeat antigen 4 n=1 Tax=Plakobranchus ocellatus TaxID=259542 RepID=A0AAV3YV02_9GAST|nr:serine repeat antigen 4 [Plakobranchus ocellatus]
MCDLTASEDNNWTSNNHNCLLLVLGTVGLICVASLGRSSLHAALWWLSEASPIRCGRIVKFSPSVYRGHTWGEGSVGNTGTRGQLQSTNQFTNQPNNQPTIVAVSLQISSPTNQPANQPVYCPTNQPVSSPTNQLAIQTVYCPINQPNQPPNNQLAIQPVYYPTNQPTKQSVHQYTNQPANRPFDQYINELAHQVTNQPNNTSQPDIATTGLIYCLKSQ